jgi:hypothetical protein
MRCRLIEMPWPSILTSSPFKNSTVFKPQQQGGHSPKTVQSTIEEGDDDEEEK